MCCTSSWLEYTKATFRFEAAYPHRPEMKREKRRMVLSACAPLVAPSESSRRWTRETMLSSLHPRQPLARMNMRICRKGGHSRKEAVKLIFI